MKPKYKNNNKQTSIALVTLATLTLTVLTIPISTTTNRILATTCPDGQFLASDDSECHPCSKLIAYCTSCTTEGVCTKCDSGYKLSSITVKDTSDPENGDKRTVKECDNLPFFSKWYGIVIILIAPLLLGAAVAMTIKLICDRKQIDEDRKAEALKKKEGSRLHTLTMSDVARAQNNKIAPLKNNAEDETMKKPNFMRMEKKAIAESTNEEISKIKDADFDFGNGNRENSKDEFDEI